jgi:hypothetical protein
MSTSQVTCLLHDLIKNLLKILPVVGSTSGNVFGCECSFKIALHKVTTKLLNSLYIK